jgi:hypothetical protein
MAPIARNKANDDVVIGNVVNNEAVTARNQVPNQEVLIELATQTVYMQEDLINRVSVIERMLKTNTKYLSLGEGDLHPRMMNKEGKKIISIRSQIIRAMTGARQANANKKP